VISYLAIGTVEDGSNRNYQQSVMAEVLKNSMGGGAPVLFYSIETPTVVVSRNRNDRNATGGHDVGRDALEVVIDPSVGRGQFAFTNGVLHISPADRTRLSELSATMARVVHADFETQTKVFTAIASLPPRQANTIRDALGILPVKADSAASLRAGTGLRIDLPTASNATQAPSMRIGRGADGLLFVQTTGENGFRAKVFGTYDLPAIIQGRSGPGLTATVQLDSSLSGREVDAIIANYKRADPAIGGGGWSGGPPNGRVAAASPSPGGPRRPLLIAFVDEATGAQRRIFQTERGRIELEVSKQVNADQLLELLNTEIAQGATLVLHGTKAHVNGKGTVFLITDFEINQSKSVSGTVMLIGHDPTQKNYSSLINTFRSLVASVFDRAKNSGPIPDAYPVDSGSARCSV
jgi:hypothetical protein